MLKAADVQAVVKEAAKAGVPDLFCQAWPTVKKVLRGLAASVSNPFVKLAIGIVLQIGNALYKTYCPA